MTAVEYFQMRKRGIEDLLRSRKAAFSAPCAPVELQVGISTLRCSNIDISDLSGFPIIYIISLPCHVDMGFVRVPC
jgi:hypothetical protein